MKVRWKGILSFIEYRYAVVILVLTLVATVLSVVAVRTTLLASSAAIRYAQRADQEQELAQKARTQFYAYDDAMNMFVLAADQSSTLAHTTYRQAMRDQSQLAFSLRQLQGLERSLGSKAWQDLQGYNRYASQVYQAVHHGNFPRAYYLQTIGNLPVSNALDGDLRRILAQSARRDAAYLARYQTDNQRTTALIIFIAALVWTILLLQVGLAFFTWRRLSEVLAATSSTARQMGSRFLDRQKRLGAVLANLATILGTESPAATGSTAGQVATVMTAMRLEVSAAQLEARNFVLQTEDVGRFDSRAFGAHSRFERSQLEGILKRGEFRVRYRPIADSGEQIIGYDAVVEGTESLELSQLVELAEAFGMGAQMERAALNEAIISWQGLALPGLLFLSVSSRLASDPVFTLGEFSTFVESLGTLAQRIVLEITSTLEPAGFPDLKRVLDRYRQVSGCKVAVGKVGGAVFDTVAIAELRPDFVKLDPVLLENLEGQPIRQSLVTEVVAFAHRIGSRVVATGLDRRGAQTIMATMDVDAYEGEQMETPSPRLRVAEAGPQG